MTTFAPVDFVLDTLGDIVAQQPPGHDLRRIDRDNSVVYEGSQHVNMSTPMRERTTELKQSNYVGASLATRDNEPLGAEYDHSVDTVVEVRIEGYGGSHGHIARYPDDKGVPFSGEGGLVDQITTALNGARFRPDAGRDNEEMLHLIITNETNLSDQYAEHHRYDLDVLFESYKGLP